MTSPGRATLHVGLMSGTSADGVDACLARFARNGVKVLGHHHIPFDTRLRGDILQAMAGTELEHAADLDVRLADIYTTAVHDLLAAAGIDVRQVRAIGCHGQTVLHRPNGPWPTTIQLGDPHRLAVRTGIDVVADFRRADLAAGGQGAPLAPAFHAWRFSRADEPRAVVNLGGIANVTILPGSSGVTGFDSGPANVLLDGWCQRHRGARFDAGGEWAAGGQVIDGLLGALLADPYFAREPPKSTGREHFNMNWLERHLAGSFDRAVPADIQATLAELTAATVADALARYAPATRRLLVGGGGARNADVLARLQRRLPKLDVESTAAHGLDPDRVEAVAFAWLARQRILGRPGNLPAVTGASRELVLGALIRAPR